MPSFGQLSYIFRKPKYPVFVEIEGALVAAKSAQKLYEQLSRFDLVEHKSYNAMDGTGVSWTFMVMEGERILSPMNIEQPRTKLKLIRWFNNRKNKPADEVEYSEKSLSSKKRDRIILEIAERLIDAQTRKSSSRSETLSEHAANR